MPLTPAMNTPSANTSPAYRIANVRIDDIRLPRNRQLLRMERGAGAMRQLITIIAPMALEPIGGMSESSPVLTSEEEYVSEYDQ
jgi:hypothetical protein